MKPIRIQRKRIKGWQMPKNTIYVGRGSYWGNPYYVAKEKCPTCGTVKWFVKYTGIDGREKPYPIHKYGDTIEHVCKNEKEALKKCIEEYRYYILTKDTRSIEYNRKCFYKANLFPVLSDLKGKNLCCWCPIKDDTGNKYPCHADVLLEISNQEDKCLKQQKR